MSGLSGPSDAAAMDALIATAIFGLVFSVMLVLLTSRRNDQEKQGVQALQRMSHREEPETDEILKSSARPRHADQALTFLYRLRPLQRLEEVLWQAGLYMEVPEMLLIIVLIFGAGLVAGWVLLGDPLFTMGAGLACAIVPVLYINFRRQRRFKAFARQLPFALDLIKASLEAGHSLMRGLQVVVQEFADPLGTEFRTALEQARLGLPLPRALADMLKRVPQEDLRLLVVAVKVQAEAGSSLAQIVGRLSEIVRARQRLQAQIRAMTAQSRMGGTIVGFLPIVVLAAFSLVQPGYTLMLFRDPTGVKILKTALALDAMAFLSIRRILRVRY
jgi:tight adherence protein B